MLNMGGPSSLHGEHDGVGPFLHRLFSDGEIIRLGPLQKILGPYIARKRTPRIIEQYAQIGGKSPIGDWTQLQGEDMVRKLHASMPGRAFKHYVAFRYAPPLTEEVLLRMKADGVTRAVAFSQYPQFSCTTAGSSMNHLWRESIRLGLEGAFKWSVIDRWHSHPAFIEAVARRVAIGLARFAPEDRDKVTVLFSAHSVPMMIVNRGDPYTTEVAATVEAVMARLRRGVDLSLGPGESLPPVGHGSPCGTPADAAAARAARAAAPSAAPSTHIAVAAPRTPHILSWQSKVGFLPWMGPPTGQVLKGLGRQGHKHVLVVPVAFTSDHVETLFEIDKEYAEDAAAAGITHFARAPSLNDEPLLSTAQAAIVAEHLAAGEPASPQYALNCAGCTNPACRTILSPAVPYEKRRDAAMVACLAEAAAIAAAGGAANAEAPAKSEGKAKGKGKGEEGPVDLRWPTPAEVAALQAARTAGPTA